MLPDQQKFSNPLGASRHADVRTGSLSPSRYFKLITPFLYPLG